MAEDSIPPPCAPPASLPDHGSSYRPHTANLTGGGMTAAFRTPAPPSQRG